MADDKQGPHDIANLEEAPPEPRPISLADFLYGTPPSKFVKVDELFGQGSRAYQEGTRYYGGLALPTLRMRCDAPTCRGMTIFRPDDQTRQVDNKTLNDFFLTYRCSNCRLFTKKYAIRVILEGKHGLGSCYKFGEFPPFGPDTPSKLIELIGPDREMFLQGRRCEVQGLGVGAFAYYRRVVEHQTARILDKIITVAETVGLPEDQIEVLRGAAKETQYSKAMEAVKDVMPPMLLINGHNPMTVLYSAISEGLHSESDTECLNYAQDIRAVLAELSAKLSEAVKDDEEIKGALSRLMNKKKDG